MKENSDEIQKLKDEIAEKEKTIKKLMDITESLIKDTREFMEVVSKVNKVINFTGIFIHKTPPI